MEALRYVPYLHPEGWVITNTTPFVNIDNYPEPEAVLAELGAQTAILIDVDAIAKERPSPRAANIVLLGAARPSWGSTPTSSRRASAASSPARASRSSR